MLPAPVPTPLPANTVLRSGETAPHASLATLKDKATKTYYHMTPGASFIMPDGLRIEFRGGQFATSDMTIISELDKVVNKPTSQIYTKQEVKNEQVAQINKAAADAANPNPLV